MAISDVQVGPCNVVFKTADLGTTKGGVKVELMTETYPVQVDQYGEAYVDEYVKGRAVKVTVPLAESVLANLLAVTPGATLVGTTIRKLNIPSGTGLSLRAVAGPLILHPVGRPAADKSQDTTIPLAACKGGFAYEYKIDGERIYELEFSGFVDIATGLVMVMGDSAAV